MRHFRVLLNVLASQVFGHSGVDSFPTLSDNYYSMGIDEVLETAAEHFGISVKELLQRVMLGAVLPEPTETEMELKAVARLAGLKQVYENRLETIDLPSAGFTATEQAKAAGRLSMTFHEMRKLEDDLKREPTPKDARVSEAERLKGQWAYSHRRKGSAAGRPRRAPHGKVTEAGEPTP